MANMINTVLSQLLGRIKEVVEKKNTKYLMIPYIFISDSCNGTGYAKNAVFFHTAEELVKYLEEDLDEDEAEYNFHNWTADMVEQWPNSVIEIVYGDLSPVLDMEVKSEIGKLYRGFNKYNPTVYRTSMYSIGLFTVNTSTPLEEINLEKLAIIRYKDPTNIARGYLYKVVDEGAFNDIKETTAPISMFSAINYGEKIMVSIV